MFIACPHCRELVAPHPLTRQLPPHCPRCGGELPYRAHANPEPAGTEAVTREEGNATPSLTSLLRSPEDDTSAMDEAAPAAVEPVAVEGPVETEHDIASLVVADSEMFRSQSEPPEVEPPGDAAPAVMDETAPLADALDTVDAEILPEASFAEELPAQAVRTDASATPDVATVPVARRRTTTPSFMQGGRTKPVRSRAAQWQWLALITLLLTLVLQVILADRDRLAAQAGWRPLLTAMCTVFRCELPAWREPAAFVMISRDVRPVGNAPGTLLAQATFRNDARWPQPWPVLLLTLKDADGRTLGARALSPQDYLERSVTATEIVPGQSAQVSVRVREPSASVVAFSFDFH